MFLLCGVMWVDDGWGERSMRNNQIQSLHTFNNSNSGSKTSDEGRSKTSNKEKGKNLWMDFPAAAEDDDLDISIAVVATI